LTEARREPDPRSFPLPASMRDEIIAHAMQESPRECCGIIAGRDGVPVRLYRATNIAPGNTLYEIDPAELIDFEFRELPAQELEIVAIYHSHPATEAYPSETDRRLAFWPQAVYLICSLADPGQPRIRGFRLRDGEVTELELTPA
jgi:[CysO sulfur-carrier protein]-S-L-cysteine hydrolase